MVLSTALDRAAGGGDAAGERHRDAAVGQHQHLAVQRVVLEHGHGERSRRAGSGSPRSGRRPRVPPGARTATQVQSISSIRLVCCLPTFNHRSGAGGKPKRASSLSMGHLCSRGVVNLQQDGEKVSPRPRRPRRRAGRADRSGRIHDSRHILRPTGRDAARGGRQAEGWRHAGEDRPGQPGGGGAAPRGRLRHHPHRPSRQHARRALGRADLPRRLVRPGARGRRPGARGLPRTDRRRPAAPGLVRRSRERALCRLFPGQALALRSRACLDGALLEAFGYRPGFPVETFPADVLVEFVVQACRRPPPPRERLRAVS